MSENKKLIAGGRTQGRIKTATIKLTLGPDGVKPGSVDANIEWYKRTVSAPLVNGEWYQFGRHD